MKIDIVYDSSEKQNKMFMEGGCFSNDEPGYYIDADPNVVYKFQFVPVEVRSIYDPYVAYAANDYSGADGGTLLNLSYAFLGLTLFFGLLATMKFN
jgi:hypothetical protein